MKKEQKDKIIQLKNSGLGYKTIAKTLGLSPSAVRSVCISKYNDPDKFGTCKNCGIRIKYTLGKKKRLFCSDACRLNWWNSHMNEVKRKAYYTFKCPCCNTEFIAYGNNKRIYCSQECYIKSKISKDGVYDEAK